MTAPILSPSQAAHLREHGSGWLAVEGDWSMPVQVTPRLTPRRPSWAVEAMKPCETCGGSGKVMMRRFNGGAGGTFRSDCDDCVNGWPLVTLRERCGRCGGRGWDVVRPIPGVADETTRCPDCLGDGSVPLRDASGVLRWHVTEVLPIYGDEIEDGLPVAWQKHVAPYMDRGWHLWHGEDSYAATPRWKIEPVDLLLPDNTEPTDVIGWFAVHLEAPDAR